VPSDAPFSPITFSQGRIILSMTMSMSLIDINILKMSMSLKNMKNGFIDKIRGIWSVRNSRHFNMFEINSRTFPPEIFLADMTSIRFE